MEAKNTKNQEQSTKPGYRFVPGAFDLPKAEEGVIQYWELGGIFAKTLEQTKNGEPYTFYDGPPFATGLPHYGHILASTIKDVIPRYQTMKGRYVRRRWGWDCHGLPIEEIVERKLGISGKKQIEGIGIGKFNETCRAQVLTFADEWGKMVRRIGRWIDFDNSYKTMDRDYMESVWWAFKQFYEKELVYEGRKVLMYCPRCETPISNFEVAMDNSYKDVTEEAVTIKFKIKNPEELSLGKQNAYILAWTTTPWTLPGNVALAVGSQIKYRAVQRGGEYLIAAVDRLEALGLADEKISYEFTAADLLKVKYEPLFDVPAVEGDKSHRVYAADFVTTTEGTGVVHTAVVYGEDDYSLGLKEGLPVVPLLDEKGVFNEKSPALIRGQYFKDSEKAIKEDLEKRGLLFRREAYTHSYPHCWRCATPLFYNAIPAWFINIQKIKPDLLASNAKEMNWYPAHLKLGRYAKSVESAPDWNISRNRYWGNPIPVWKCEKCGEKRVAGSIRELGLERNEFLFTRHGEAENNVLGNLSSYPEPTASDLTPLGEESVRALGEHLKKAGGVDAIYASDLLRTKRTAEILLKAIGGVPINFDERLREKGMGIFNGKSFREYRAAVAGRDPWEEAPEGGETLREVEERMVAFISEVNKKYEGKRILVVGHEDPLRVLRRYYGANSVSIPYATEFSLDVGIRDLHRPMIDGITLACEKCGGASRRVTEIFDSWVEAGSMPFAEYHYPFENQEVFKKRYPGQFIAEYIAQTRAWFYVLHVISQVLFGKAPVQNLVTTGNMLSEDGSKMSKSKNNFPDPWLTINKYGADSLRFYLMNAVVMQADDQNFAVKDLENIHRKVPMILWNVFNYFATYAREAKWRASSDIEPSAPSILDRWILARTQELVNGVTEHLDGYDTVHATRTIMDYIDDLSTWYLRRSRGRADGAFFGTLHGALLAISTVIAPIMPHLAEIIYLNLAEFGGAVGESVHLAPFPAVRDLAGEEKKLLRAMAVVREAASAGQAARKALNIPVRQPLARCAVELVAKDVELSDALLAPLLAELNVKHHDPALMKEKGGAVHVSPGTKDVVNVYLDTALTDQLKLEGLARGFERCVQEARKQAGFSVGEKAILSYETAAEDFLRAMEFFDVAKTYSASVEKGIKEGSERFAYESEGKKIEFALRRT